MSNIVKVETEDIKTDNLPSIELRSQKDVEFEYVKQNILKLIEDSTDVLKEAGVLAKESEHPRAIEVYSGLLHNVMELNLSLLKNREMYEKNPDDNNDNDKPNVTNNNLYVGSSHDLLKLMKDKKKFKEIKLNEKF